MKNEDLGGQILSCVLCESISKDLFGTAVIEIRIGQGKMANSYFNQSPSFLKDVNLKFTNDAFCHEATLWSM